jgi:hypothetical protein
MTEAPALTGDAANIYAKLVAERGLVDTVDLAIAARCAQALIDPGSNATAITALLSLLPEQKKEADGDFDIRRLDDHELAHLEFLTRRARGLTAWKPPRRNKHRMIALADVCDLLDLVQRREGGKFAKLTDDERDELRSLLASAGVWPSLFESHFVIAGWLRPEVASALKAKVAALGAAAKPTDGTPTSGDATAAAVRPPANVVQFHDHPLSRAVLAPVRVWP